MLEWLIAAVYPLTGPETMTMVGPDIRLYEDEFGSRRFVKLVDGISVAGLQLVTSPDRTVVANIYTHPSYRRRGYMTELFREALARYPALQLSKDRSDDGKLFVASLHVE